VNVLRAGKDSAQSFVAGHISGTLPSSTEVYAFYVVALSG